MRDLFDVLKAKLKTIKGVHTVEPWNNQEAADAEGKQKATRREGLYIEFVIDEVRSIGLGVKDKFLTIRIYMSIKNLRSDKSKTIDWYQNISAVLEGLGCTRGVQPYYSSLFEKGQQFDVDHDNVELPFVEFGTIYRDVSGYYLRNYEPIPDNTTVIVEGINIVDR